MTGAGLRNPARLFSLLGLCGCGFVAAGVHALPQLVSDPAEYDDWIRGARARLRGARLVGQEGVVLQEGGSDCGAACLKMIFASRGIERSLSSLRLMTRTTPRGTSLRNLRLAAELLGVDARSWTVRTADIGRLPFPAIAFVNGDHFVVLRGLRARNVLEVDDPALGRLHWPIPHFIRSWDGQVLVFDPAWLPP